MNRSRLAILLSAAALAVALIAAVGLGQSLRTAPVPLTVAQTYFAGNYKPGTLIDIGDINIGPGEFRLTYSFTVNYTGPTPASRLVCELKDPNGTVTKFEPNSTKSVTSSAAPQRVSFSGNYQLPYVDVGIRCHSSVAGGMVAHFSRVKFGYSELG